MTLTLIRGRSTDQGTPGILLREDATRVAYTLELPWKDNQRRVSCIPGGSYPVRLVTTPRHGKVYNVQHVPGRDSILIHSGNVAGDTTKGLESDVLGCILLGRTCGARRGQRAVLLSRVAIRSFMDEMAGEPFTLEVVPWTLAQS